MIEIDGSYGEGGGQVLRTSLALSILTGEAVHITNVRGRRSKPGLQPQHLKAVDAAAAISRAEVQGAALHSAELTFTPGELRTGRYKFDIGTAGSTSLVLQTIFLPLSLAGSASTVLISGGTHVPNAPCYHYLELQWLPFMRRLGFDAKLIMEEAGFYPEGGGKIIATIRPAAKISPLILEDRGEFAALSGLSAVANLDTSIADRQKRQALGRLLRQYPTTRIKLTHLPSRFKGTLLLLQTFFQPPESEIYPAGCFYGLGARSKPAERVADEAVDELELFLASNGAIDAHLADQILLPLAVASGISRFHTARVTRHLLTNAWVIGEFTDTRIAIEGEMDEPGWVEIHPGSSVNRLFKDE